MAVRNTTVVTRHHVSSFQNPVNHALVNCSLGPQKVISVSFNLDLICGHACESAQKTVDNLHSDQHPICICRLNTISVCLHMLQRMLGTMLSVLYCYAQHFQDLHQLPSWCD